QGALAEMRALIFQLRPLTLQEEGLLSALKKHLSAVQSREQRGVELNVSGTMRRLPAPVEDAAFRIVQESLNNVIKHASATRTQVLIVDDHGVVREGLRAYLELEPDIEVVGEARDGQEGVRRAQELQPDVVLMDLVMPNMDGVDATSRIKEQQPDTHVIVLTSFL